MPGFLIDLDGTLYHGKRSIPHADEFIRRLQADRLPYLLVTNNSSRTPEQVADHLRKVGIEVRPGDVFTSAQAAALYLQGLGNASRVYCVGEAGLQLALREAGFELAEERPDAVVQGIDRDFSYAKLELAVKHIRAGAAYVLTNPDHLLPTDGGLAPGAGSLAAAIRTAAGVEPAVIGKPSPIIMGYAIGKLGLPPEDVWVIGDNLATDIGGGRAAGCRTALVLTGLATKDNVDEQIASTGIRPDVIAENLKELWNTVFGGL
jgi:4-nitrophenyl phosphatase